MFLTENPWHYVHPEYWGGPTWSQHPLDSQFIHGPWTTHEVQWVVAPFLEIFLSTMKAGNFQSCLLDIPYLISWYSHGWISYRSYETFRSLCIIQRLHLQYELAVALMISSDDQITAYTHTCFFCSFLKFSSLCKALGSVKGSSALCLFHSFGCRYQAPYRIFTCFGLQVFYGK